MSTELDPMAADPQTGPAGALQPFDRQSAEIQVLRAEVQRLRNLNLRLMDARLPLPFVRSSDPDLTPLPGRVRFKLDVVLPDHQVFTVNAALAEEFWADEFWTDAFDHVLVDIVRVLQFELEKKRRG